jgi:hypothetical protein
MAIDHQVTEFPRNNFASVAIKTTVNAGPQLRPTAALLAIMHDLAQVGTGKVKRRNMPPRSGKSLLGPRRRSDRDPVDLTGPWNLLPGP